MHVMFGVGQHPLTSGLRMWVYVPLSPPALLSDGKVLQAPRGPSS